MLELPCVFPRHLGDLPELAQRFPRLTIVIDHLGKPPLGTERMGDWAAAAPRAAEFAERLREGLRAQHDARDSPDWSSAGPAAGGRGRRRVLRRRPARVRQRLAGLPAQRRLREGLARDRRAIIDGRAGDARRTTHTGGHPARLYRLADGTERHVHVDAGDGPWSR